MLRMLTLSVLALPLVGLPLAGATDFTDPQVQALIEFSKNGISQHLMEVWIESQPRGPQPDSATILLLTKNKVPDSTIEALIRHNAAKAEAKTDGALTAMSGKATGYRVPSPSGEPTYIAPATTEVRYVDPYSSYSYDTLPYYDPWWGSGLFLSSGFGFRHRPFFHHGFSPGFGIGFGSGFHHGGFGFAGGFHHR
jgi:hypothetical protein